MASFTEQATLKVIDQSTAQINKINAALCVRSWPQSGRHMFVWSFSAFDPKPPRATRRMCSAAPLANAASATTKT
ncbi:hypothetical protein ABIF66_008843 [Bradyrhizobium japonicum]|uniref:hypothetical protein n=1 Tax=Bradyrhizobium liaoningense TaxID=43992 RepID=UPI001BA915F0|nr:hypothetical protein [Bradyrhizobium liaoningense]MBR1070241.1 hypothetical protein [Bradyrhizobium liaoningense]